MTDSGPTHALFFIFVSFSRQPVSVQLKYRCLNKLFGYTVISETLPHVGSFQLANLVLAGNDQRWFLLCSTRRST